MTLGHPSLPFSRTGLPLRAENLAVPGGLVDSPEDPDYGRCEHVLARESETFAVVGQDQPASAAPPGTEVLRMPEPGLAEILAPHEVVGRSYPPELAPCPHKPRYHLLPAMRA